MRFSSIVILTGAGISAESGLSTFRDEGGLWAQHRIEDVATPEGFARNPDLVQGFYNKRRAELKTVEPHMAHVALADLERLVAERGGQVTVITQNVDDLHERAGSKRVLHMHGELNRARCTACHRVTAWSGDLGPDTICPTCQASGHMRPHVVWFGEIPLYLDEIETLLAQCDLFVSIGTSGNVYPAAGFVAEVRRLGRAHTIEVNLEPSEGRSFFAEARHGPAGVEVPRLVADLLDETSRA